MRSRPPFAPLAAVVAAAVVSCSHAASEPELPTVVQTAEGPVRGRITSDPDARGQVRVFLGIPFAAPPIGGNRFRAPQPVAPWVDTLDAKGFGRPCAQVLGLAPVFNGGSAEDCLYLNVWTPPRAAKSPRPVMVWIHGGAFIAGSAADSYYDGAHFVEATDVVLVSLNYRLGPFGFLGHPSVGGNFGLLDQRAALEWVRRNIAAFGGDPANVTLFGESAGGVSVSLHMLSPESAPLFHRAIAESGPPSLVGLASVDEATQMADDLARALGCAAGDFVCLRGKPVADVATALKWDKQPVGGFLEGSVKVAVWWPIVDGAVVKRPPEELLRDGALAHVPFLLGTMSEEGKVFHAGFVGDIPLTSAAEYAPAVSRAFGAAAPAVLARYPVSQFASPNDALAHILTLASFACPTRRMARASVKAGNATFLYQMTRPSHGGSISSLGPVHASDIAYLFDTTTALTGGPGEDGGPLVTAMQGYWKRLAATGDPNGGTEVAWPRFGADEPHVVLNIPVTTAAHLDADECDFWDTIPAVKIVSY